MHTGSPFVERPRVDRARRRSNMRPALTTNPGVTHIATRRRIRQRHLEESSQRSRSDETSSSHSSKSAIRKCSSRRRYVKSKPPKVMPGGRVICAGQGTLTEVSKSFYVAYGSADLSEATRDIHLVVPVKDELQEATDDERSVDDVVSPNFSAVRSHDRTLQELDCASLFLDSPRMVPLRDVEANTSGINTMDDAALMVAGTTSAQLPLNWMKTAPWNAASPQLPAFPTKINPQVSGPIDFDSRWFSDIYEELTEFEAPRAARLPPHHRIHRNDALERPSSSHFCSPNGVPELTPPGQDDCSYFHLADELMPENKTPPTHPQFGQRYWEMLSSHRPRCGMAPVEMQPMLTPQAQYYASRHSLHLLPHWEAEPLAFSSLGVAPPFSSLPHPTRRLTEINPPPMPPPAAFFSEHAPYLHTHSNLLI